MCIYNMLWSKSTILRENIMLIFKINCHCKILIYGSSKCSSFDHAVILVQTVN